jgi:flagellar motor protein MotB
MSMTRTAVLVIGILLAPGWKPTIDGHTDNIGGDVKNLDLSRRRAEAAARIGRAISSVDRADDDEWLRGFAAGAVRWPIP